MVDNSVPAIRTFQMDGTSVGKLASAVNLFRGDVNLTQPILTMPDRGDSSGLDLNISAQYQSNVTEAAATWNRDAPTGVLGLGWSFPLSYIEAGDTGSPVPDTRSYTLYENGTPNSLYRQPTVPVLFSLARSMAGSLKAGEPVPRDVLAGFHGMGLPLSADAIVSGSGPWTIDDGTLQQIFTLTTKDDAIAVSYGGECYALQNYKFYTIIYFQPYERWLIVTEGGTVQSYGGLGADTPDHLSVGINNSIGWSVWWRPQGATASWTGPSTVTGGQVQVARAWYLASVRNRFGEQIAYAYNGWARDPATGLIPDVEQRVGVGGLPFTKAVYLTRITDVFGRTVDLEYGNKLWGSGETDPREYADPHRAVPSTDPSPYQDRYETKFLAGLTARDTGGVPLFGYRFLYDPRPGVAGRDSEVANVTVSTGRLAGDTYKRYLTGMVLTYADGTTAPPLSFAYYLDQVDAPNRPTGYSPGALKSITYPEGAVAHYDYSFQSLPACDRTVAVSRPASLGTGGAPRVFFGADYAIVTYYNANAGHGTLTMQIYTWTGAWLAWQLSESAVIDTQGLDLNSLDALTDGDFAALHFNRLTSNGAPQRVVYVFQKDTARQGQWLAAEIDGRRTAPDTPSLVYDNVQLEPGFVSGSTFFVVSNISGGGTDYLDRVTFRWTTMSWTVERIHLSRYTWLTARGDYYAALGADGTLAVSYLDGNLTWRTADPVTIAGLSTNDARNVAVVAGSGMVVVSNLLSSNQFRLWVARWDASYAVAVTPFQPVAFTPGSGTTSNTVFVPSIVEDTMIAVNGVIYRFNGQQWLMNQTLTPPPYVTNTDVRYAYGPDYVVQILAPKVVVKPPDAYALGFDPTRNSESWTQSGTRLKQTLPAQQAAYDNWPSGGSADWAVVGPYVYFRGVAGDWGTVVGADAVIDLSREIGGASNVLNSDSLVNEAPGFLSFVVNNGANPVAVNAAVLRNGTQLGALGFFVDQKMTYPAMSGATSGAGRYAGGPQMVMTYPATALSFDAADTIYLTHFAGAALQGDVSHFAVAKLTIDYGYESPVTTLYEFDTATAACDPSGRIIKYFSARLYPDSTTTTNPPNGYTETKYLNGLTIAQGNYYNMLDGMLRSTSDYDRDGRLRQSTTTTYQVFEQVSLDPGIANAGGVQLRGGFATAVEISVTKDGLTTTKTSDFIASGQPGPFASSPVLQRTVSYTLDGTEQIFENGATYGVEIYAGLRAIHALADVADTYSQVKPSAAVDAATIPIEAQATTCTTWPTQLGEGVTAWAAEAQFALESAATAAFPFAGYEPGQVPAGWTLGKRLLLRTRNGLERESVNALGVPTGTLYARNDLFPIAQCTNATAAGLVYTDFQPYDPFDGWTFENTLFLTELARTGVQSLGLPGGANASAAITIAPHGTGITYVAGCWYRTGASYEPANESGISAVVTIDGDAQPPVVLDFEATDGVWVYRTVPISIPASEAASPRIAIALRVSNTTSIDVAVDAIALVPLANGLIGRTFDEATHSVLSSMQASGATTFSYYDDTNRVAVTVGPTESVQEIALNYLSRSGSVSGGFNPESPNTAVTANPAGLCQIETFRDGGAWRQRWSTGGAGAWIAENGVLTHDGSAEGTLSWTGPEPAGAYALYLELIPAAGATVAVIFGDITVRYANGEFTGTQGSATLPALAARTAPARQWYVQADNELFLFFAGGQLLFSAKTAPADRSVAITLGGAPTGLKNLALGSGMRLGLIYNDAAERQRQAQQLIGDDSHVIQTVNDGLNRKIATTKAAPASFGSGAELATLQYRPGFVDVAGFLANLASTWEMPGDVADYYRGQSDGPVTRSNDEGYPYFGTRFEASPREVTVESGAPGRACAINLTVPIADRQTIQLDYGASNGNGETPVFSVQTITSPVKIKARTYLDMLTQQVAATSEAVDGSGTEGSEGLYQYAIDATGPSVTVATRLPNAVTSGPQSGDARYVRTAVSNPLQQPKSTADTDSGAVSFIHDSAGNLRFVQPALDGGEAWYIYYKFDTLNRMIEQGTAAGRWDPAILRRNADDPDYPTADTTVSTQWRFDGDGTDPNAIGFEASATSYNPAPEDDPDAGAVTVATDYTYGANGLIRTVATRLSGAIEAQGTFTYSYNPLNEVTAIGYPDGSGLTGVFYTIDQLGHIVAIGTHPDRADLGAFTFSPDGNVAVQSHGEAWTTAMDTDSRGNPIALRTVSSDRSQSLAMAFAYAPDGAMTARDISLAFHGVSTEYHGVIGYDGQRRFNALTGTETQSIASFDPNGNIWSGSANGAPTDFTYDSGTDRLATARIGEDESAFVFNARGQQIEGLGRTIGYDRCIAMPVSVARGDNRIRLAYGDNGQRVLKQGRAGSGRTTAYFNGASSQPLALLIDGEWTTFIQGPTGLLAVTESGARRYPLKDSTQSVWALVDDAGLVAHYAYMPYGEQLVADPGDGGRFAMLFQGQEWDAEVGLYNFKARLYDPRQMRFLVPDPQNQFPSPYLFGGNIPLVAMDPSGQISVWARVGIGVAMVAVIGLGLVLTPFTGGASDAVAGSIDAALVGAEASVEVGAGVVAAEAATTVSGTALATIGNSVFSGVLVGAGLSGLQYDVTHGRDFTAKGFFTAVGIGAAAGAASGLATGGITALGNAARGAMELSTLQGSLSYSAIFARVATKAAVGAVSGAISSDVSAVVTNLLTNQPWYQGLGKAALMGAATGGAGGAASSLYAQSGYLTTNAIGSLMDAGGSAAKVGYGLTRFTTSLAELTTDLSTRNAYAIYGVVAFHIAGGYAAWGAYELSRS